MKHKQVRTNIGLANTLILCSGLRAPQLRIRPRPCPISFIRAKIIVTCSLVPVFRIGEP